MQLQKKEKDKREFFQTLSKTVDHFIGVFSPQKAVQRKRARVLMNLSDAYLGARSTRLHSDWLTTRNSADGDILPALCELRRRSRALIRNDAYACGAVKTIVSNVIGTGIHPQSTPDIDRLSESETIINDFQKKTERGWADWCQHASVDGKQDFDEIQHLIERQIIENGDVFVLLLRVKQENRPYDIGLQIIEADRVETPPDLKGKSNIRAGIEFDDMERPIAYYVREEKDYNEMNPYVMSYDYKKVMARDDFGRPNILHLYWHLRPGQTRGVPLLAPVMPLFKHLEDYMEAELMGAKVAACYSIFIEKQDAYDTALASSDGTTPDGDRLQSLSPGSIGYLNPGESIKETNPNRPGNTFDSFVERLLRAIATAIELPYEVFAKDLTRSNYSSARTALLEARRFFISHQKFMSRKLCQPIWNRLVEEMFLAGELKVPEFYAHFMSWTRCKWIAPGWPWVDPLKDIKAAKEAIDLGVITLSDVTATQGNDWEEILEQTAREKAKKIELGLINNDNTADNT